MPALTSIAAAHLAAIFMYHHVSDSVLPGPWQRALTTTRAEFAAQLDWLQARGCTAVTVSRLWSDRDNAHAPACEVALTFDDGYDDAQAAEDMLKAHHDAGTFYVSTGYIGAPGHLTTAQIKAFLRDGMDVGSHTVHHVDLAAAPPATVRAELVGSSATLQRLVGVRAATLAYPSGRYTASVERAARGSYDAAVTTQPGLATAASDPYALPRYRINRGEGLALMKSVLGPVVGPVVGPVGDGRRRLPSKMVPYRSDSELKAVAAKRAYGNERATAAAIAFALLRRDYPEEISLVRVLEVPATTIAGITLSGAYAQRPITKAQWLADVRSMIATSLATAPSVAEVDVWATVPIPVMRGAPAAGDMAVPTTRTVFSVAVRRSQQGLGAVYMDAAWARQITSLGPKPRRRT